MAATGSVYVLTNPALPGLVKIGYTTRSAEIRARELSTTSIPSAFEVAYESRKIEDFRGVERRVHEGLVGSRVDAKREFFRCTVEEAALVVQKEVGGGLTEGEKCVVKGKGKERVVVVDIDDEIESITVKFNRVAKIPL